MVYVHGCSALAAIEVVIKTPRVNSFLMENPPCVHVRALPLRLRPNSQETGIAAAVRIVRPALTIVPAGLRGPRG
jgi:hypothetical protein